MRSNNLEQPIKSLEKALELSPKANNARFYMAQSYLNSGQTEEARKHANVLLETQPDLSQALSVVTLLYLMDYDGGAALESYWKFMPPRSSSRKSSPFYGYFSRDSWG